jgi:NAD(P)-dependent dehydrogenase (short-subunit alcohol dehydrogenase family)
MGSVSGRLATAFMGPYAASKFALNAVTDSLRGELRPFGIKVIIVEPANIATPIWDKSLATGEDILGRMPANAQQLYGWALPRMRHLAAESGRAGAPAEEVARAVAHALTAPRPRTRYPVARGARLAGLFGRLAPDGLRDRVIARRLKG